MVLGSQPITISTQTNSPALIVGAVTFTKNGYDASKSNTESKADVQLGEFTLDNIYVAGINDRDFTGNTIKDYMCPVDYDTACKSPKSGLNFFVI
jgi:hypothetical protein